MRKILFSIALIFSVSLVFAQKSFETLFNQPQTGVYQLTYSVKDFDLAELTVDGVTYQTIDMGVSTFTNDQGWAQLPFISASVELPAQKDVDLNVIYTDYVDIPLDYPLLPSRGTIYRNQDPSQIPYEIAPESLVDEFYPQQMTVMEDPFIFREVRGTTVRVFPFQYNAVTNTLRFYKTVTVELVENDNPPTNPFLRERVSYIREVEGIYNDMFLNYDESKLSASLHMEEYGDILVITTSAFEATMAPYITWKKEMGYNVTTTIVANATNVTSTISAAYTANPNLLYVQLAGEWANIKSPTINVTTSADPCDAFMGAVSGSDNYIDISVGRFSCASTADLTIQINKAITYEKTPDMTTGWREDFIGIGSSEGSGIGDDNEIDYTHIQRIYTARLDGFTYDTHNQNYDPGATAATLATHINAGASTIAYCGHGDVDLFGTTLFSNTNINSLTNGNKLPFIVSVACLNGSFHTEASCFAEAWLRKSGGGAVVTWMSTINQPWQPPQRGQDYFYDILIGGFNYDTDGISATTGYNTTEQRTHWGSIVVNASVLMLTQSSASDDIETIKTWTTFGDASLQLRTKTPVALTLSNSAPAVGSVFSGTAYIGGSPAENVLICLSQGGVYYSDLTDATGAYSITHDFVAGSALLVGTAFNSTTIYSTVTVTDSDPCFAVNDFAVVANGTAAELSWTAPSEGSVTGYKIYRDGVLQTTVTGLTYSQSGLANGSYEYCVAAVFGGEECYLQECGTVLINDGSNDDCVSPTALLITEESATEHSLTWTAPVLANAYFDDIESHTAFTINSAGTVPWTFIDGDATTTYSISNYTFTNQGLAMATIVFDPNLVLNTTNSTPLTETTDGTPFTAHSGDQFFASFNSGSVQTNDWIVSPQLNFTAPFEFSFFARSGHKSAYPESFKVAYSTTTNAQASFTNTVATVASAPFAWTEYSYTIPANAKYVAINCNSNDMYYFCVDDIYIGDGSMPGAALTGYNVYCDGVFLGNTASTSYTNAEASEGYHEYCVEAVYADACISPQVCETIGSSVPTYTITASSGVNGTVTPTGVSTVNEGGNKTYTITPNACYQIANVLVDGSSVGVVTSYTFTNVTANHTISATFSQISYTVSTSAGVGGSITGVGATALCGSSITFTVVAEECYQTNTVTVNGTPVTLTGNNYTINNVNANTSIVATFAGVDYDITATAGVGGTISPAGITNVGCLEDQLYIITADENYHILAVYVNGVNQGAISAYVFENVSANATINAEFESFSEVGNLASNQGVSVFPNPAGDYFELVADSRFEKFEIVSLDGKIVMETKIVNEKMIVDISDFAKGVYFVRLSGVDNSVTIKLNKM